MDYTYAYIHSSFFFSFFSHLGHYRVLSRVPCAIRRFLFVSYLFYSNVYTTVSPNLTIYPSPHTILILKYAEMKLQQIFLVPVSYSSSLGLTLGACKRIVPGGRQLMRPFFRPLNNLKLSCDFLFPPFTT